MKYCLFRPVGKTSLLKLGRLSSELSLSSVLLAKLETENPTGSSKDRTARFMVEGAEKEGKLLDGSTLVCASSGNMGIALASIAAKRGYRAVIVMPSSMSVERRMLLTAYGAEVVLVDGDMTCALETAKEIAERRKGVLFDQFTDVHNPEAHYKTTGPELWKQTKGRVDVFVAGVGSGGTLTGTARFLKERSSVYTVAVEPKSSPFFSEGKRGKHGIEGIGAGFCPKIFDFSLVDEVFPVTEEQAIEYSKLLARKEGILCGISSGAALCAAVSVVRREEFQKKNIVVLLPDSGERYLSTGLFG